MMLIPNSAGFAEANSCHNPAGPKGGQFCDTLVNVALASGVTLVRDPRLDLAKSHIDPRGMLPKVVIGAAPKTDPKGWGRKKVTRGTVLSVVHHEIGHSKDNQSESRPSDAIVAGHRVGDEFAREVEAWEHAIRTSRAHRVDLKAVHAALLSYAKNDLVRVPGSRVMMPREPKHAKVLAAAATEALRRYGRALRRVEAVRKAKARAWDKAHPKGAA